MHWSYGYDGTGIGTRLTSQRPVLDYTFDMATPEGTGLRFAADATHFYWADVVTESLYSIPKAGGASKLLAAPVSIYTPSAVDDQYVYFTLTNDATSRTWDWLVVRLAKGGGTPEPIASLDAQPKWMLRDGASLFLGGSDAGLCGGCR